MTEDEMAGWHHRLNGHEFELTPGQEFHFPNPRPFKIETVQTGHRGFKFVCTPI